MLFYLAILWHILSSPFKRKPVKATLLDCFHERVKELPSDAKETAVDAEPTAPSAAEPAFIEEFSDLTRWNKSEWGSPGNSKVHGGEYWPNNATIVDGALSLMLEQYVGPPKVGGIRSLGAEVKSLDKFHYGTYEFLVRFASEAARPTDEGKSISGGVSVIQILTRKPPLETDLSATDIQVEVWGDVPDVAWVSNSATTVEAVEPDSTDVCFGLLTEAYHKVQIVWEVRKVSYWIDDVPVAVHTSNVPYSPAKVVFSHYGTNAEAPNCEGGWGGVGSPKIERRMFVKRFSYIPA